MRSLLVALLVLAAACVVEYRPPPPSPLLSPQEAVNIATQYARSRGVIIDETRDVYLDRHAHWHVDLGGAGGRSHAAVMLDGYSGRVLSARLRGAGGESLPQPPPAGTQPEPPAQGTPPEQGGPTEEGAPPTPPPTGSPPELPGPPPPPPGSDK
jgi:hypothetical protein